LDEDSSTRRNSMTPTEAGRAASNVVSVTC